MKKLFFHSPPPIPILKDSFEFEKEDFLQKVVEKPQKRLFFKKIIAWVTVFGSFFIRGYLSPSLKSLPVGNVGETLCITMILTRRRPEIPQIEASAGESENTRRIDSPSSRQQTTLSAQERKDFEKIVKPLYKESASSLRDTNVKAKFGILM